MICTEARERMLEAERPELEGRGGSDLARHVRRCAPCRTVAARVVREEDALGSALAASPAVPVEEVLERLRDGWSDADVHEARPSPSRARRWGWWSVPAAAAAVLLAVALSDLADRAAPSPATSPSYEAVRSTPAVGAPAPVVEAGDREVAVFATSNPNITVAWIYQEPIE